MMFLIVVLIFWAGFVVGFFAHAWYTQIFHSGGTIFVQKTEGKTLYSLELEDYPERIEFKKKIIFKVEVPGESLDRE